MVDLAEVVAQHKNNAEFLLGFETGVEGVQLYLRKAYEQLRRDVPDYPTASARLRVRGAIKLLELMLADLDSPKEVP